MMTVPLNASDDTRCELRGRLDVPEMPASASLAAAGSQKAFYDPGDEMLPRVISPLVVESWSAAAALLTLEQQAPV